MINRTSSFPMLCAISLSLAIGSTAFAQTDTNAPAAAPVATPAPATPPVAAPVTAPATETPAAPSTPTGERPSTYTVVAGDSLWSIAHKFDTSIKALQKENNLKPHALLHPGQVLKIPPAKTTEAPKAAN